MLQEETVNGQRVILANNGALVASKSQAGAWHIVKIVNGVRTCCCKGFQYRGRCSHVNVVEQLEREQAKQRECDTAILAGPATVCRGGGMGECIDPPMFTESRKWERPKAKTFEELFGAA